MTQGERSRGFKSGLVLGKKKITTKVSDLIFFP